MPEPRITALAIRTVPARLWTVGFVQTAANLATDSVGWFVGTSQRFAALVSAVMGPAIFVGYVFACWSLSANLGWTDTFPYSAGPLSNWLIWAGIAIGIHAAADVLRRHTRTDK
jgi:hypothetical protein